MKSRTEYLEFNTGKRVDFINITDDVEEAVRKSGVREGLCLVNAMHITASLFINDAEEGLLQDFAKWLEALAPHEPTTRYEHNLTGEVNGDATIKRTVMGRGLSSRSRAGSWISARGSRSTTASSTAGAPNGSS